MIKQNPIIGKNLITMLKFRFLSLLTSFFILLLWGSTSCVKTLKLKIDPYEDLNPINLTEISVPADFDWETSTIVEISLKTLDNTGMEIPQVKLSLLTDYKNLNGKEIMSGYTNENGLFYQKYKFASAMDSVVIGTDYLGFISEIKVPIYQGKISFTFGGIPPAFVDETTVPISKSSNSTQLIINYLGTWLKDGTPKYLISPRDVISSTFLSEINNALPQYQAVPDFHPSYLWDIYEQNISLTETSKVWITFVSEGSGYYNTLAYYTFDKNNPPLTIEDITQATVIFPNASFKNSGGGLYSGDKVYLGEFPAGTSLGWLMITNGYDSKTRTVTNGIYNLFSHEDLNPETNSLFQQHIVLLKDIVRNIYLISFEDMLRPDGDQDFNDAIFYATVDPVSAVETSFFHELGIFESDTDNDGVPDNFDEYPEDATIAFNNFYPSEGTFATLAFEDLWPARGDYDFNDLIVDYNINTLTNIDNQVSKLRAEFVVRAIGAGFHNGFGFQLQNILSTEVSSVSGSALEEGYIYLNANGTEAGQSKATIIAFDDAWNHGYANTDPSKAYAAPTEIIQIEINFTSPIPLDQLGLPPFNPFLIVNKQRGREIHMANYPPTDLVDPSYFGQFSDNSDPASGRYYKTETNLPWVLNLPSQFDYSIEKSSVDKAHLRFIEWVESGGSLYNDWYLNLLDYRNIEYIY
jgi:LruC domain-containing protein